jgi:hypothetical protein
MINIFRSFSLLLFIIINLDCTGQQVNYQYAYGTPQAEQADHFKITKDGGCIVTGSKVYPSSPIIDYILKTDSAGNILWSRDYFSTGYFSDCVETFDGGYMIIGTHLDSLSIPSVFLVKTDSAGNVAWSNKYGNNSHGDGFTLLQTNDSGFVIVGDTMNYTSNVNAPKEVFVFKINRNGNVLWSHTFGGAEWDECRTIWQATNGGFYLLGTSGSFGDTLRNIWLTKIDENGQLLWSKTYGGANYDFGASGINTRDGGLLVTGIGLSYDSTTWSLNMIKMNSSGDTLWTRLYKKPGNVGYYFWNTIEARKGGFVLAGSLQTTIGSYEGYLLKTDSLGNFEWADRFSNTDYIYEVQQCPDDGFMLLGLDGGTIGSGSNDILLIKTDEHGYNNCYQSPDIPLQVNSRPAITNVSPVVGSGCVLTNVLLPQQNDPVIKSVGCYSDPTGIINPHCEKNIVVFPNPSTGEFQVKMMPGRKTITLINMLGETIQQEVTDQTNIKISVSQSGTYTLNVIFDSVVISKEIIIIKQ